MKLICASIMAASLCGFPATQAKAAFLLSDNTLTSGNLFMAGTPKITTGATYTLAYGNIGNTRGNTDSQLYTEDNRNSRRRLTDGYSTIDGNTGIYSSWGNGTGTGSGDGPFKANVATIILDLKAVYRLESASLNTMFKQSGTDYTVGVGTFQIWISTDGQTYTQAGTWTGDTPALSDLDSNNNITLNVALSNVDARYVMFYVSKANDAPNHKAITQQIVLGEIMVYGDPIPEPASLATLTLSAPLLLSLRRR